MPNTNALRKHVFDDVVELVGTTGMLIPLLDLTITEPEFEPLRFLRHHFALHTALIVTRLYARPNERGRMGATASIPALLQKARDEERLTAELAEAFIHELGKIRCRFEAAGGDWNELRNFRDSELAHSLHPYPGDSPQLSFLPLWDLAHETYELPPEVRID